MIQSGAGGLAVLVVTTCPAVAAHFDFEPAPSLVELRFRGMPMRFRFMPMLDRRPLAMAAKVAFEVVCRDDQNSKRAGGVGGWGGGGPGPRARARPGEERREEGRGGGEGAG